MLIVYYQRKLARVFSIDFEKQALSLETEFEAGEGRSWLDVVFSVFKSPEEEFEDWIVILEKNSLCSAISWYNPETKYTKQEMVDQNLRVKRVFPNFIWRSSLMSVTESGSLVNVGFKIPSSWVRFSYKFAYINDNVEYVEKEDEFDRKEEEPSKTAHIQLNKALFDTLPGDSLHGILQKQNMFSHSKVPFKFRSKEDEERKLQEEDFGVEEESANEQEEAVEDSIPDKNGQQINDEEEDFDGQQSYSNPQIVQQDENSRVESFNDGFGFDQTNSNTMNEEFNNQSES